MVMQIKLLVLLLWLPWSVAGDLEEKEKGGGLRREGKRRLLKEPFCSFLQTLASANS